MPDGITVSIAEMYALLQRIDRKVDSLVQTAEGLEERVADHEARLRVLEALRVPEEATRAKVTAPTIVALVIASAAVIVNVLLYTINR